ncbi:MAG: dTDP-4-dehydrorhamnose 3,5-epimerase family protein [Archaeoglobaceae archaeon]
MPLLSEVKELSLPGVKIADLSRFPDERGVFTEIMRSDWEIFEEPIAQSNLSITYPGIVRAWHRHVRGQVDYFVVVKGAIKVCAYEESSKNLVEIVLSESRMQVLRVPGKYWHGFKVVSPESAYLIYFTNKLYDYKNPDEERRPWNDQSIVPSSINGKKDDPRVGKPWNWFEEVHR